MPSLSPRTNQEDHLPLESTCASIPDTLDEPAPDADFVYISFDAGTAQKRKDPIQPARSKKRRKNGSRCNDVKLFRDRVPCLRCKILKKECDNETPCKQCPQRGNNEKGDYWKVLGCLRNLSSDLRDVFLPDFYYASLGLPRIESPVLTKLESWSFRNSELDLTIYNILYGCLRRSDHFDSFLDELEKSVDPSHYETALCWAPALRPLSRLRNGNQADANVRALDICIIAKICKSFRELTDHFGMIGHAFTLLERQGYPSQLRNYSGSTYTDIITNKDDNCHDEEMHNDEIHTALSGLSQRFESFSCMDFGEICSRRRSLVPLRWIEVFCQLCLLSILEKEIFDVLCRLVQRDKWEQRGIKSSKDFLMGLGSGFYSDGTYIGFYIQQYGLKVPSKKKLQPSPQSNEEGQSMSPASLRYSASQLHQTEFLDEEDETASEQRNIHAATDNSITHERHYSQRSTLVHTKVIAESNHSHQATDTDKLNRAPLQHHSDSICSNEYKVLISYCCLVDGCRNVDFATLEELNVHRLHRHGYCTCPMEGCERKDIMKGFDSQDQLLDHMRRFHDPIMYKNVRGWVLGAGSGSLMGIGSRPR